MSGYRGNGYGNGYRDQYYSRGRGRGGQYPYRRSYRDSSGPYEGNEYSESHEDQYHGEYRPSRGGSYRGSYRGRGRGRGGYYGGYQEYSYDQGYHYDYPEADVRSRSGPSETSGHSEYGSAKESNGSAYPASRNGSRSAHEPKQPEPAVLEQEKNEVHWITRLRVGGEMKNSLSKQFEELDKINKIIDQAAEKRLQLEMDVERYSRAGRSEDVRCKLAEEKLEALNFI
ncbi:hypothetical protein OGAPHI_002479 [Ogataea philodendri]|uniref:Transcription regulator LGE1 helical region domain-containing protein n=1 Tax=Ogataea philodendri TaxID=1378263 RepID=A0A9P8PBW7_9ASCO|nr:uncharacterized protein OGAPHI_002479 [Ogataea philodendri]KAH3668725.1 hypothetical protein OGAPHI_002479 [Ogataea philodendri]